jgi:hypothetical protein
VAERLRRTALVVAGLLVTTGLTGCSNGTASYCSTLKDDQKKLDTLATRAAKPGEQGVQALGDTVGVLSDLRDEAPDDISDEWNTLVGALQGLVDAVKATGHPLGDFAGGTKPDGVTSGQYDAVEQAATELQDTRVQQAGKSIEQHAQDVCKVDLGTGLGGGLPSG